MIAPARNKRKNNAFPISYPSLRVEFWKWKMKRGRVGKKERNKS
jgi:hypothetical protein